MTNLVLMAALSGLLLGLTITALVSGHRLTNRQIFGTLAVLWMLLILSSTFLHWPP